MALFGDPHRDILCRLVPPGGPPGLCMSFDAPLHNLTVFDWWHPPTKDIFISRTVNGRPFANESTWHGTVSRRDDQLYVPYPIPRTFKTPFSRFSLAVWGVWGARTPTIWHRFNNAHSARKTCGPVEKPVA